jgi:hypothetical protein
MEEVNIRDDLQGVPGLQPRVQSKSQILLGFLHDQTAIHLLHTNYATRWNFPRILEDHHEHTVHGGRNSSLHTKNASPAQTELTELSKTNSPISQASRTNNHLAAISRARGGREEEARGVYIGDVDVVGVLLLASG